jgi:hypothetical protein
MFVIAHHNKSCTVYVLKYRSVVNPEEPDSRSHGRLDQLSATRQQGVLVQGDVVLNTRQLQNVTNMRIIISGEACIEGRYAK